MTIAVVNSRAILGVEAHPVTVEVHISPGTPALSIVGLPETAVKESKDRVRSAIINSGFDFPIRRITINLAPADLPKREGGRFDLAIAIGVLAASKQILGNIDQYEFSGELALDGSMRSSHGVLPLALAARKAKHSLILPRGNADEASLVQGVKILAAEHLLDVCAHLNGTSILEPYQAKNINYINKSHIDLKEICGQEYAKRSLEIAAAGGHSLLMVGPPGVGKTMLASRLTTILPDMSDDEALETAAIYSICGKENDPKHWKVRPFRAPHHSASSVALVGGSSPPRPGEISLAHNGVLFLDELLEFNRSVLESLREPLESKHITVSRAACQARFPANFQLIIAMNPCPCGYYGDKRNTCNCTQDQIRRYRARVSGPFLDRIDMQIIVPPVPKHTLMSVSTNVTSAEVRARVECVHKLSRERLGKVNANMSNRDLEEFCALELTDKMFLEDVIEKLKLSARSYHRIIKIARTIADLDGKTSIQRRHLQEAVGYRRIA